MRSKQDYLVFIEQVAQQTGLSQMKPDADGVVSVRIDDAYNLTLSYVEVSSKIHCFIEMMTLPENTPASIYRELLAAGLFGQETAGGSFALETESNTLVYQYLFDFDAADFDVDRFTRTLEKILSLVDLWVGHIASEETMPLSKKGQNETPISGEAFLRV